jgi:hypothetical protein
LILQLFQTYVKEINLDVLILANKFRNKMKKETSANQTSYQNKIKISDPTKLQDIQYELEMVQIKFSVLIFVCESRCNYMQYAYSVPI